MLIHGEGDNLAIECNNLGDASVTCVDIGFSEGLNSIHGSNYGGLGVDIEGGILMVCIDILMVLV